MIRRFTWALGALVALSVSVGSLALAAVFQQERDELLSAVRAERAATEGETARAFDAAITARLEVARLRIARMIEDPAVSAPGVLMVEGGRVVIPRALGAAVPPGPSVAEWIAALGAPGDELADRVAAIALVRSAREPAAITRAYRALLVMRAREVLDPRAELATTLVALEALGDRASDAMVRAELATGLGDPTYGRVRGLAEVLAVARSGLTAEDRGLVCARATAIADKFSLSLAALDRACTAVDQPVPDAVIAATASVTALRQVGDWWLRPDGDRVIGAEIPVAGELRALSDRLIDRGLEGSVVRLVDAQIAVEAPRWREVSARADGWYYRKLFLLAGALFFALSSSLLLTWSRAGGLRREREVAEIKARFAATVSHELQTPLAAVRVMAETLERRLGDEPRARDYPKRIVAEVDRLGGLVDNILAFQRIEQGRWKLRKETVRLDDHVAELSEEASRAAGRGVSFTCVAGAEIVADPDLLRLALLNLVRNACRHNKRTPVRIALRCEGQTISVEDNGVGVSAEDAPRLFGENMRGQGAVGQGTGLGLALVDRIARLHGGRAVLRSTSPEGSTFVLELT